MLRQGDIPVFPAFTLHNVRHFPVKIQMPKLDIPHFHTPESTPVDQSDEQFMLQEFSTLKHVLYLFSAEYYRNFLQFWTGGKMQVAVRPALGFQEETQPVNSMFKVRLG